MDKPTKAVASGIILAIGVNTAAQDKLLGEGADLARIMAKTVIALGTATTLSSSVSLFTGDHIDNGLHPDARATGEDLAAPARAGKAEWIVEVVNRMKARNKPQADETRRSNTVCRAIRAPDMSRRP